MSRHELVTMVVADQHVGVPVRAVRDIIRPERITPVPGAPATIAGVLNLRGRIVTALDLRQRLGLPPRGEGVAMSVVVEHGGELYSLMIDAAGDVLRPEPKLYEADTLVLSPAWRDVAAGMYRLADRLLVILDVERVLHVVPARHVAA